jgi:predicted alpha-1,2-mannosidase
VGQYAHGNEPSHHIAYLYAFAGAPHKTQARVRSLLDTMYHADPDGMAGNEDVGQMSAWLILSALGFYPVDPVSGNYVLGSPIVESAKVRLGEGRVLEIEVKRTNPADAYIQAFTLNGKRQERLWFRHKEIASGGHILLEMVSQPNLGLGTSAASLPPSLEL